MSVVQLVFYGLLKRLCFSCCLTPLCHVFLTPLFVPAAEGGEARPQGLDADVQLVFIIAIHSYGLPCRCLTLPGHVSALPPCLALSLQLKEGEKLDRKALMQEAISERLKEAQELERKLARLAKTMDHMERARREEEAPLLDALYK